MGNRVNIPLLQIKFRKRNEIFPSLEKIKRKNMQKWPKGKYFSSEMIPWEMYLLVHWPYQYLMHYLSVGFISIMIIISFFSKIKNRDVYWIQILMLSAHDPFVIPNAVGNKFCLSFILLTAFFLFLVKKINVFQKYSSRNMEGVKTIGRKVYWLHQLHISNEFGEKTRTIWSCWLVSLKNMKKYLPDMRAY